MTWSPARASGTLRLSSAWLDVRFRGNEVFGPRLSSSPGPLAWKIVMLRYLTSGESHGQALTAIVEGFPSGVTLDTAVIDRELERRQGGHGRGKRQKLETDRVIVDAGVYHGVTTGGPITIRLVNKDAKLERLTEPAAPRGGHIDLAGAINYQTGIRQVLERASAARRP